MSRDRGEIGIVYYKELNSQALHNFIIQLKNIGYTKLLEILPLGCKENSFDWEKCNLTNDELKTIITRKILLKENIGLHILRVDRSESLRVIVSVEAENRTRLKFYFDGETVTIPNLNCEDFSHYINILYPLINLMSKEFELTCRMYVDRDLKLR